MHIPHLKASLSRVCGVLAIAEIKLICIICIIDAIRYLHCVLWPRSRVLDAADPGFVTRSLETKLLILKTPSLSSVSLCMCVCLTVCVRMSVCRLCLSAVCVSVRGCLPACLCVCLSVCLSVHLLDSCYLKQRWSNSACTYTSRLIHIWTRKSFHGKFMRCWYQSTHCVIQFNSQTMMFTEEWCCFVMLYLGYHEGCTAGVETHVSNCMRWYLFLVLARLKSSSLECQNCYDRWEAWTQ